MNDLIDQARSLSAKAVKSFQEGHSYFYADQDLVVRVVAELEAALKRAESAEKVCEIVARGLQGHRHDESVLVPARDFSEMYVAVCEWRQQRSKP